MLYSSGTTGRPKGVRRPLRSTCRRASRSRDLRVVGLLRPLRHRRRTSVYLSPAPLYHAAPLAFTSAQHRIGATAVIMRALRSGARAAADPATSGARRRSGCRRTSRRLLALPEAVRKKYDLSSPARRRARGGAVPDPREAADDRVVGRRDRRVLRRHRGRRHADPRAASGSTHPGSVGRHWAGGKVHILDEDGSEITEPTREGAIYFEAPPDPAARFTYHKDDDEDRRDLSRRSLHDRRHRLPRRRGLPVPDRSPVEHDHLGRREHLPAGDREPPRHAPEGRTTSR